MHINAALVELVIQGGGGLNLREVLGFNLRKALIQGGIEFKGGINLREYT